MCKARGAGWQTTAVGIELTLNMVAMLLTLEASKLSGWLKEVAPCRVRGGGAGG